MAEENSVDIRFMLVNGSDIGPTNYSLSTTVGTIKEDLLAQWPRGGDGGEGPQSIYEIRMIHLGRTLDNRRTLAESGVVSHLTGGEPMAITMHVVQQPHRPDPPERKKKQPKCECSIL